MKRLVPIKIGLSGIGLLLLFGILGTAQSVQFVAGADLDDHSTKIQAVLRGWMSQETEAAAPQLAAVPGFFGPSQLLEESPLLSLKAGGQRVQVVMEMASASAGPRVLEQVAHLGGEVELAHENWVQASLPVEELHELAAMPEVRFIRLPVRPFVTQGSVSSEGLSFIGSQIWNESGLTGQGVKVALLDPGGFRGYENMLGRELPAREQVTVRSFRPDRQIYEPDAPRGIQVHGLATAEIVHDIAPEAELYLTMFSTDVEFIRAIDWLIEQQVNVINTSLGYSSGCFRTGGIFEPQLAKAHRSGITWATAAGNEADIHWEGTWQDPDGNNLYNYTDTDEGNTLEVRLLEYRYPDGRRVATSIIDLLFSWDAPCANSPDDYEVVVLRETEGQLKPLAPWDGSVGQINDWLWRPGVPIKFVFASEDFDVSRVGQVERYHLAIRKKHASAENSRFEMLISCPCRQIEYLVSQGSVSITEPSISPSVITVGAVHHSSSCARSSCPDGRLLFYSSQGPTKDGRVKPDLAAPAHVSTSSYGRWTGEGGGRNPGFTGTSAASPHVAGAAALIKQAFPEYTPDQIKEYLEQTAEDFGEAGKDNRYGAGVLTLGQPPGQSPTPTIGGIDPTSGLQGKTIDAVIQGTNLAGATAVTFSGSGVTAALRAGGTETTLPIAIAIAADASPGARTFSVSTSTGTASSGEIAFTVLQAPVIAVEPESLSYQAVMGEGDPAAQILRITNAGGGTLSWEATADVPWLALSVPEGSVQNGDSREISVKATIAQLSVGDYEGHITLTAPDALNSPLTVSVTLTVQAPAGELIALVFTHLEFTVPEDWERTLRESCVVYTNVSSERSLLRVTLPDGSLREFEIPPGNEVIVCADVVHIDTRPPSTG
jgi:subtilisin family serine protease